ncbi:serine/threonine-protein kinase [Wenzhouxiangella sp. XN24]|uniref:serine/threonine-protein kinase n=1 Tax=Wenzhouxiangella sp. XN24 TaxID=2713569 RepID=UPI0013EB7FC4|nr:serine/threonine-protein kinase [Wenzhouxiangella sp. XN24]NGX17728.1 serine/threonine protein kinase [Wenzhouxiangella sp. XN24]
MAQDGREDTESPERWQRISQLFHDAMAQPQSSRLDWLRDETGGDEGLFLAVANLLGAADEQSRVTGIIGRSAAALAKRDAPASIGRYEILSLLGEGGMGDVYLARRADGEYTQQVAIKVLGSRRPGKELIRRFQAERQILANLDHPNIARLIDGGETGDGLPYLVMEFVAGTPITTYCDENRLTLPERLKLFRKVCGAVENAHRNLVIHRDIKPSNILVTDAGEPKLLDFGIAKLLEPGPVEHTLVETLDSARLMTPRHASPEQVRGDRITIATDIYSLGVLLYELLSGHFPYEVTSSRPADIERAICESDPPSPSSRVTGMSSRDDTRAAAAERGATAGELKRFLGGDLDNIVLTAMQKDPERRYATVRDLADDIRNFLADRPVMARADSVAYRARKFLRRNRVPVTAAAVTVLGIGAAIGISIAQITAERDAAEVERRKAEEVSEFMLRIFEVSAPEEARGKAITARELLDAGARRIRAELSEQPEVQARMLRVLGETYYVLGEREAAEELLRQAVERTTKVFGEESAETATAKLVLGFQLQDNGHYEDSRVLLEEAMATRRVLFGAASFEVLEALSGLAFHAELRGDYEEAETMHREALELAHSLAEEDDEFLAEAMTKLGGILRILGENDEAERLFRDALAMQDRLYGGEHPESADTKRQLAGVLRETKRFEESEQLYKEVIATRERILGPDHLEVAHTWNSYSRMLGDKGDAEAAIRAHQNFIDILERAFDGPHPSFGAAYNNLAVMLQRQNDYEGALQNYQLSIDMQDLVGLEPDHPNRSFPLGGIGAVYLLQERYADAAALFRDVLAMRIANFPAEHRLVAEIRSALGASLAGLGEYDEAEQLLLKAAEDFESEHGLSHPGTLNNMDRLVDLYERRGDAAQAERWRELVETHDPDLQAD